MFGLFPHSVPEVTPGQVVEKLGSNAPPLVVDVREPEEYAEGRIPGSRLIPLGSLKQHLAELPAHHEIVAVCRSGARSASATEAMRAAGLDAVNMKGGMLAWRGPVEH
jgi:rhodanese-related sulfurtransferase